MRNFVTFVVCGLLMAVGAAPAQEKFPSRPLRILVGFGPGSGTDILAREVAVKMADHWNQGVVVDNRPGAGAVIASEMLARATDDGHTMAIVSHGQLPLGKFSKENIERRLRVKIADRFANAPLDALVPMVQRAEDLLVVVIGGAGKHSAYIHTFGATQAVTRALKTKDGKLAKSVQEFRQN